MKQALFFHYDFPPAYGANVGHMLGIVHHLPEYGWNCHVICGGEATASTTSALTTDFSAYGNSPLITRVSTKSTTPPDLRFGKLATLIPTLRHNFPDSRSSWIPMAVEKALALIQEQTFDAVISSCPSESNHVAASLFAKKIGIPWLPIFGDLYGWYLEENKGWRQRIVAFANNHYFRNWIRPAKRAICVSPAMSQYLRQTYGIDGKVAVVGANHSYSTLSPCSSPNPKFTITYTGSVYPDDERPDLFLDAIKYCVETSADFARLTRVLWIGTRCEELIQSLILQRGLESICEVRGWVEKSESLQLQAESDLLLALNTTVKRVPPGTYSYPSKIFEYLSTGRPILIYPSDREFMTHLMSLSKETFDCVDLPELTQTLLDVFHEWKNATLENLVDRSSLVTRLSQSCQTATIARELDLLCQT